MPGYLFGRILATISRVILISAAPEPPAVAQARYRGVRGLLLKNADVEHVLDGHQAVPFAASGVTFGVSGRSPHSVQDPS